MFKATKEFRFEMAHILSNYNGACGNLHGHSYKCLVTLESNVLDDGMVLDFSTLKQLVNDFILNKMDHAFAYNSTSTDSFEKSIYENCKKYNKKVVEFPFRTTAENMSKYILDEVNGLLVKISNFIYCSKVELYETTTGHATYED